MIVLGIDPGTASLGYGIVESRGSRLRMVDAGTFHTRADVSLPQRLLEIHGLLDELIALHRPDIVAVERLFFSRNAQTAFGVGQARGVVLLAAAQAEVPVREATPNEIKVAVTGYGSADKAQVGRMVAVCLTLPEPPTPDDTADALAVAIWAAHAERPGTERRSSVLDRAAVDPLAPRRRATGAGKGAANGTKGISDDRSNGNGHDSASGASAAPGESGYERAVKEALARESRGRR